MGMRACIRRHARMRVYTSCARMRAHRYNSRETKHSNTLYLHVRRHNYLARYLIFLDTNCAYSCIVFAYVCRITLFTCQLHAYFLLTSDIINLRARACVRVCDIYIYIYIYIDIYIYQFCISFVNKLDQIMKKISSMKKIKKSNKIIKTF